MDLPTYTNIWRIEKRLYKLYDLRLPMPLPLVQIGVFAGVFVPWILLLKIVGIPFESPWHVLYIVPPGVLTWLATRPVIEGKRLTELLLSQTRYLAEPRTWCRLTPIREPREVVIVARVWRRPQAPAPAAAPERAALKTRRKARRRQRPEEIPAFTPTAALPPTPAIASEPRPLAEHAAQEWGALNTEDDVRVAGTPTEAPAAPPAAKPWHRPTREIAHEEEALERPPATPQLEFGASGKRAFASGIRRAGSPPEFWKTPEPPTEPRPATTTATDLPAATDPGEDTAADRTPAASEHAVPAVTEGTADENATPAAEEAADVHETARAADTGAEPSKGRAAVTRPQAVGQAVAGTEGRPTNAGHGPEPQDEQSRPADDRPAADVPAPAAEASGAGADSAGQDDGTEEQATGVKPAAATRPDIPQQAPATRPDIPQVGQAKPTRPDIPMVPGAFGAADRNADEGEAEAPRREPPKPWSEELSKPLRAATTDALVWPPIPAPRDERPTEPEQPAQAEQPTHPESPAHARWPAQGDQPAEAEPPARDERPVQRQWPGHVERPAQPAQSESSDHARWPAEVEQSPHAGSPAEEQWPAPAERPAAGHAGRAPMAGPGAGHVREEPPREVRSGPASPVRPRPLPPPPPAPPSEPAITPPDPEQEAHGGGGLRRLIHAVGGGHGEADAEYQQRLQQPFQGTRHIVVLGCTGGAGQTVTALMLGHTFAQHNGEPVVAIDVNPGPGALARRTRSETNETLTGLITRADQVNSLTAMRRYTSQAKSGLEVVAAGKNPLQALDDRDYALAMRTIDRFYSVTLLDAAAAVVARVLPYADQVVLVAPASADAPRAVAMTYEWLDGHGYEELRSRAVTVINGVSRRSMDDVEQAESVARGRCRALVRIPWDDHLSMDRAPRNELRSLRAPTRRAYLALAGVVAGGFAEVPERYQERQQEQEATR
ncbi:TcpE family conjugal transfer membrane protein [Spirillospora sp. NPDC029432]|uniref:TcpE family conjugal transfer membrane protein n=1 Tax=Spirillospora sp. NPDC029432 TaxID=3154599 RepID=UPI00345665CE